MRDLGQIQRWMQAVLMHPDGVAEGVASGEARRLIDVAPEQAESVVTRSRALSGLERLAMYGRSYYARLVECLRESYPVLRHALGEEAFDAFAVGYLQKHPSRSYTLNDLGADFPSYLRASRAEAGEADFGWPDFVIDLATLERAYDEVFDGPGAEGAPLLDPEALRAVPPGRWPEARLVPVPCLRLLELRFPAHEYYTAVRREQEPEVPAPAETLLAVTRRDYVIRRFELARPQYALLEALLRGEPVGDAIAAAAESAGGDVGRFAASLGEWFREWTAEGLFQAVTI